MKKLFLLSALATAAAFTTSAFAQDGQPVQLERCEKPLASVMVGKLTCKSANCDASTAAGRNSPLGALLSLSGQPNFSGIGNGIRDMFVTTLQSTGCVTVQERETLDEIAEELKRAGKTVKVEQADYLISGALTTIELEQSSNGIGFGMIPFIGSIDYKTQKATLGLDMKLVDVNTAKVVDSQRHTSVSEKRSFGVGGAAAFGGAGFGDALSALKGTSLEVTAQESTVKAANGVIAFLKQRTTR